MLEKGKRLGVITFIGIMVLMSIFFLIPSKHIAKAAIVNSYSFTREYLSKSDGKIEYSLTLFFPTDNLTLNDIEKLSLKNALTEFMTTLGQEELSGLNIDNKEDVKLKDVACKNGHYSYSIEYPSSEVFNKYNKLIEKTSDKSTFTIKTSQKIANPFSQELKLSLQSKLSFVLTSFSNDVDIFKPSYFFIYTTFNPYAKSNAESVISTNEGTSHIWEVKGEEDMQINLTRPQAGWWYLLAILIPLALAAIVILIIYIYNWNKKRQQKF